MLDTDAGDASGAPTQGHDGAAAPHAPAQTSDTDSRPAGYDPVDLSDLPEDKRGAIEQRLSYLYKQAKQANRSEQALREFRRLAEEQSRRIEELTEMSVGVANHLQEKTYAETESALQTQLQEAFEHGDTRKMAEVQDKLIELKAKKLLDKEKQQQKPPAKQQTQARPDVVDEPYDSVLAPHEQQLIDVWQNETDDSGQLLRPWAFNRGTAERPDPQFLAGLAETQAVWVSPRFAKASLEEKIAEVDRRMGVRMAAARQNVMGANLTRNAKPSRITLTPKEQEIAVRTRFGGPDAKTDADHIEAYRKQIELSRHKKGPRT